MTSLETIKLEDQSNHRLNEISKIKDYFNEKNTISTSFN